MDRKQDKRQSSGNVKFRSTLEYEPEELTLTLAQLADDIPPTDSQALAAEPGSEYEVLSQHREEGLPHVNTIEMSDGPAHVSSFSEENNFNTSLTERLEGGTNDLASSQQLRSELEEPGGQSSKEEEPTEAVPEAQEAETENEGQELEKAFSVSTNERSAILTETLNLCARAGGKKQTIGKTGFENAIRSSSDNTFLKLKGKAVMGKAFQDAIGLVAMNTIDRAEVDRLMNMLALRHYHYGVTTDLFPQTIQALLAAMEQLCGDSWDSVTERVWGEEWGKLSSQLIGAMSSMGRRVEIIKKDWEVVSAHLGIQALVAKISANLVVLSVHAAERQHAEGGGGPRGGGTGIEQSDMSGLAEDIGSLLSFLVDAVFDLKRLRGLTVNFQIPWRDIFKRYKAVPNLEKVQDVVLSTMQEVVGGEWSMEHAEAWTWLWSLALADRKRRWHKIDRERALQAYQTVEAAVMRKFQSTTQGGRETAKDFYAEDASESGERGGRGKKMIGFAEQSDSENGDRDRERFQDANEKMMVHSRSDKESSIRSRRKPKSFGASLMAALCCKKREERRGGTGSVVESQISDSSREEAKRRRELLRTRIEQSYEVKEEVSAAMAEKFFELVPKRAPNLRMIFEKRQDIYKHHFGEITKRLLAYLDSPEEVWKEDPELAIKHIEFGVMPCDVPVFANVFLQILAELAGPAWTQRHRDTWDKLFSIVSGALAEVVSAGLLRLTRALVFGSLHDLREAQLEAPRGKRIQWNCKVEINGEERSPLFWMIEKGRTALARQILRDVLAIRANRSGVHYGREALWTSHGRDLVKVITDNAPDLWWDLLDGHIWCSDLLIMGKRKVNMYIHELWGDCLSPRDPSDPEKGLLWAGPSTQPLWLLMQLDNAALAQHPVVEFIVQKKWELYARRSFYTFRAGHFISAFLFSCGYMWLTRTGAHPAMSFSLRLMATIVATVMLVFEIMKGFRQHENHSYATHVGGMRLPCKVPFHFAQMFTLNDVLACLCVIVVFIFEVEHGGVERMARGESFAAVLLNNPDSNPSSVLSAFVMLLLWFSNIQTLMAIESVMMLVILSTHMLEQLAKYIYIIICMTLGFSGAIWLMALWHEVDEFDSFPETVIHLVLYVCGAWTPPWVEITDSFIRTFFAIYAIAVALVLLPALVAIFADTCRRKIGIARAQALLGRAKLVVDIESTMHRPRDKYGYCPMDKIVDAHLKSVFEERLSFDDARELGPAGGISVKMDSSFIPPGIQQRNGRADRIERYENEEGDEMPWPRDQMSRSAAVGGSGQNSQDAEARSALESLGKSVKSLSAVIYRVSKLMASSGVADDGTSKSGATSTHNASEGGPAVAH